MNPFVNPKKRSVELPKGYKDLGDVLRARKCEYCDDDAVASLGCWPDYYRWCEACQREMSEFAKLELPKAMPALIEKTAGPQYWAGFQRRLEDFMRAKVNARKLQ